MRVTLYVLKSKASRRRYVGITNDLPRRLREHASRSTHAGRLIGEFELLHTEVFPDHTRICATSHLGMGLPIHAHISHLGALDRIPITVEYKNPSGRKVEYVL